MWMAFFDNMAITLDGHVMPQSQLLWHPRLLLDKKRLSTLTYYISNWTKNIIDRIGFLLSMDYHVILGCL
jgi:hypothetical protein